MDYRSYYEELTGMKVPKKFDVHHIDCNRENNDIENLVALPKHIHSLYHKLRPTTFNVDTKLLSIINQGHASFGFMVDEINAFYPIYEKCCHWLDFRNYLLGRLPDIRNMIHLYQDEK